MKLSAMGAVAMGVVAAAFSGAFGEEGFTDVTAQSGVAEVVRAHYADVPKWWLSGMDLIDVDGDGDLDLHLAGHGYPAAAAVNDGKGRFTRVEAKLSVPRGVRAREDIPYGGGEVRLACDFDEDGKVDLLCSWHDGGGVLYLNDCRPGPPAVWNFKRGGGLDQFNRAAAVADLDRDGNADYLADAGEGRRAEPSLLVLFGQGGAAFGRKLLVAGAMKESGAIPVDIDGDGDLDLLVSQRGYNPAGRRILLNDGRGGFADATAAAGLDPAGGSIHGAGDLDQDGDLDLICVEGRDLAVYLNDGRGRFRRKADAIAPPRDGAAPRLAHTNWGGAVVTDIDNDGTPDVLVNGRHFLAVLRGLGDGKFAAMNGPWRVPTGAWSAVDEGLCFGDIDGDGDLDLVACGRGPDGKEKGVAVLRNDLAAGGWLRVRLTGRRGNRAATGAKIRLYEPGGLGDPKRLIACEQVAIWGRQSFHSYYTAAVTERHFGLGLRKAADVSVEFYPSGKRVDRKAAASRSVLEVHEEKN